MRTLIFIRESRGSQSSDLERIIEILKHEDLLDYYYELNENEINSGYPELADQLERCGRLSKSQLKNLVDNLESARVPIFIGVSFAEYFQVIDLTFSDSSSAFSLESPYKITENNKNEVFSYGLNKDINSFLSENHIENFTDFIDYSMEKKSESFFYILIQS